MSALIYASLTQALEHPLISSCSSSILRAPSLLPTPTPKEESSEIKNSPKPRVSIITSLYKGEEFIRGFLENITSQTIFAECELIIGNVNSPENEEPIIREYQARYPNIRYAKWTWDPGIYGIWNWAIKLARADFITNANLDDRRAPFSLEIQAQALEAHPEIDLVYADIYVTEHPNSTWEEGIKEKKSNNPKFSLANLRCCFEGPGPMWRKSIHERAGLFNPWFTSSGDWEFWNRAAFMGCTYMKMDQPNCLYYLNPHGLSTTSESTKSTIRKREDALIFQMYKPLWDAAKDANL